MYLIDYITLVESTVLKFLTILKKLIMTNVVVIFSLILLIDKIVTGVLNHPLNMWNRVSIGNCYIYLQNGYEESSKVNQSTESSNLGFL